MTPPSSAKQQTPRPGRAGSRLSSSTGKKAVMAVTGVILVLYLVAHVAGNLKIFAGAEAFNEYAHWLRHIGEPAVPGRFVLTLVEVVLAVSVVLHMWAAVSLARRAARARPVRYAAGRKNRASGYAARTMRYGGVIILLFVIWHLLDLTFATVNPAGGEALPYDRMVQGFAPERWPVTLFYAISMIMIGLHLRHGLWSAFQTLGLTSGRTRRPLQLVAGAVATLLVLGFLAVPFAVTIGVVK
ncbi:succinate dehydrogenase / fumarate reductase cytochrome b subunit [Thermostaphylospora chromogena]|uniref:Succinate dehydrogenase / fumarate reductase cytochrome b subunit n=2 Tax=Thermostaphylospora chromogena TaxID=35622 RepID=A0A1H1B299_9ACTN|nr:succinate dehydrogenase / fumarate reductase cytochrome b subunit [Thermostaphylospora chromogena]